MRSGETCMLQSAMQMFVARFASRPACCRARCKCLWPALRQDLHVAERDANVCGPLCVKTCMLQSAMQMFVPRFASRPACCRARCKCLCPALRQDLHVAERDANVCAPLCVKTCMLLTQEIVPGRASCRSLRYRGKSAASG